jgi:hypothetical protein
MNTVNSLWPEELVKEDVVTPFTILKQQAIYLGDKTKNIVIAEVVPEGFITPQDKMRQNNSLETTPLKQNGLRYNFYLVAPFLGNLRYLVLSVVQPGFRQNPFELLYLYNYLLDQEEQIIIIPRFI